MSNRHRITYEKPELTRFHGARIRAALLEVAGALRARPEPRDMWDDLGRADASMRSMFLDKDVLMCRQALTAAAAEGAGVLADTTRRVERYFAEKLAASMYGFESKTAADLAHEIRDMTRETAEAITAAADFSLEGTEACLEQLRTECFQATAEIEDVLALASARLAQRQPTRLART